MTSRTRVLVITRNLPPLHGGIERLMQRAIEALSRDFECHVVGPIGCRSGLPADVHVTELPAQVLWFYLLAVPAVLMLRLRHRFSLCVAGNGLVAPLAAIGAALAAAPWLVFVHGLDLVARHPIYQTFFVPSLRRARIVIANSRYTARIAEACGIARNRVIVVHPGVALGEAPPVPRRSGVTLLSVGRLVPRKGLAEFVEHALPRIIERNPQVQHVIVGEAPSLAVRAPGDCRERIMAAAQRAGVSDHVRLVGAVPDAELHAIYAAADVLVFPSLGSRHDAEGFGMVILEAAAHGVPTVAFDVGGVGDAVSPDNGVLVSAGDYGAFAEAVSALLDGAEPARTAERCRAHAARFGWDLFAVRIREAAQAALHAA